MKAAHAHLPVPDGAGRRIAMPKMIIRGRAREPAIHGAGAMIPDSRTAPE